jgi:sulfoxide reductase heme-binding subunit YedZ
MDEREGYRGSLTSRSLFRSLLAIPALWLLARWASGAWTYGDVVSRSGALAAQLLLITAVLPPLGLLFPRARWLVWLRERRPDLGTASAAYAAVHIGAYVIGKIDPSVILEEARQPWLLVGWLSGLMLLALTAMSDAGRQRILGQARSRLHALVYAAAVIMVLHWVLQVFDPLPMQVQTALHAYGYYDGPFDGVVGPLTRNALERFQRDHDLRITGTITSEVLDVVGIVRN